MRLIDTAEMYSDGASERLVGKALIESGVPRSEIFLVSKVYPWNAGSHHIFNSCKASLARLGTDYLDLYLLHWRGSIPLAETVECMEALIGMGLIKHWGVSNFDIDDMEELWNVPSGDHCQVNQVLYNLGSRGIEYSLEPWLRGHNVATMAYCPLAQAGTLTSRGTPLLREPSLRSIANKHQATVAQIMLAWVIRAGSTIAIPMSSSPEHMRSNAESDAITLDAEDLALIDQNFPTPTHKVDLATQ
jgi:diketogulonate reductase-like aldo/keto reductase